MIENLYLESIQIPITYIVNGLCLYVFFHVGLNHIQPPSFVFTNTATTTKTSTLKINSGKKNTGPDS